MIDKSRSSALWSIQKSQTLQINGENWPKPWQEEDDRDDNRKNSAGAYCCSPCIKCCIIASLICGIALAIAIALWLTTPVKVITSSDKVSGISLNNSTQVPTSSTTSTSTTTNASTSTSTSSASTSSTSTSSTSTRNSTSTSSTSTSSTSTNITNASASSTMTTSTTTAISTGSSGYCNGLRWNLIGVPVAGLSTSGTAANQLDEPSCLYIDENDSLYICDSKNERIQKWLPNATSGITISNPSLTKTPEDVAVDKNGFVYVSDSSQHHVVRYPSGSLSGTVVAGKTNAASSALTNLDSPTAIVVTENLTLYIIDAGNSRVVRWNPNATSGTLVISTGSTEFTSIALVPWSSNQLYLSSKSDDCVYRWALHASTPQVTLTQINASSTQIGDPWGIKTDTYGNLYVTDNARGQVFIYCPNSTVGHVAIGGTTGSTPSLPEPYDVAVDSNFNLYVVDGSKNQVFKYQRI